MPTCENRIQELKQYISEIDVGTAYAMQKDGAIIIDVRTLAEYEQLHIQNSVYLGRDFLEFKIEEVVPNKKSKVIMACGGGFRSLFAAESLISLGYNQVYNMQGGFKAWHASKLPITEHE